VLFELDEELVAVAVLELDQAAPKICDLHVVAIANDHQGARTATDAGEFPLVKVVLDTALARAAELRATRVRTIVARDNARSTRMLLLQGFIRSGRFDRDYDEYAARLT
jgi:RimJ/RimL family protein N-acetyltransferase